jgi:hypothetical protein
MQESSEMRRYVLTESFEFYLAPHKSPDGEARDLGVEVAREFCCALPRSHDYSTTFLQTKGSDRLIPSWWREEPCPGACY